MVFFNKSLNDLHSSIRFFLIITIILNLSTTNDSISFNIPHFQQNDFQIKFEGDSFLSGNIIQLTKNSADDTLKNSVGRITYSQPIQLWDATTGRITDFDTHFSFVIKGLNESSYGDGLTFFLAPLGSKLPPNSHGGSLGLLTANVSEINLTRNQIVAVEFDSFKDPWDLCADHVGVNINSVVSVATASWDGSIKDGCKANAWVRYNATTKNLTVFLTYAKNPLFSENSTLYHIFDLSKVLPEQITIGFSASTGLGVEIHKILSWKFNSTLKIATENNSVAIVMGLIVGIGGACGLGVSLLIWLKKRRENTRINNDDDMENSDMSMDDEFVSGTGAKRFSYIELVHATCNFDEGGKLGEGGFGGVYKGFLSDLSLNVAVKRVSRGSKQGKKEYKSEVRIISQLRHRNLVQLVGWCHKRNEMLLVYEFMPNRSLDKHLFRGENVLPWDVRYKIAIGLASALLYLHEYWEQCVVHRDIKSSNVMLDSNFNAKLGDFGLARLVDHELGSQTTVLAGTMGYLAPECILCVWGL